MLPKGLFIKYKQHTFKYLISRSKVSFTNGSAAQIPVRKFFEIPAYGSLLAAEPFYNASSLGFKDGINYVKCNSNTIADVVSHACNNLDWTNTIIKNARKFIYKTHSELAWAKYIKRIYTLVKAQRFQKSVWVNGQMSIEEK